MKSILRRALVLTALALLLASTLAAVVVRARDASTASSASTSPAVLRWANEGISDIYTLDPARGPDFNARQPMQLIFGGLVRFGPRFRILPDLATSWSVSADGRTYTFHLRPTARFADGRLLSASDVVFSLNRVLSPQFQAQGGSYLFGDIAGANDVVAGRAARASGIQALDDHTIRIRLTAASGSFLAKLANPPGYIVPSWRIRADPAHWDQHALGTGPFMVGRWIHNDGLLLVPNPYYYGGKPRIGGIDMPFVPEPLEAFKRYRAGAVDLMGTIHFPTNVLYDVQGRSDFYQSPRLETIYLTLNERQAPFGDARVREALAHALDKKALAREAFNNFAHPTNGMLPPGIPGYNPQLRGAGYNPNLARHLLALAGFPGGRGMPEIAYPVDQNAQSLVLAHALEDQWRRVLGVRMRLVQYTHSRYLDILSRLDYQIAVIDWTADFPDPSNFLTQLLHTGSPNNNGHWSNATFDGLTDRADRMAPGDPARFGLYHRAEEMAMDAAAAIPLVNPTAGILLRQKIQGMQISGGYILVNDWTRVMVESDTD